MWLSDSESRFPKYLAQSQWLIFTSSLDNFCESTHVWSESEHEKQVLFLREKLHESFMAIRNLIGLGWETATPYRLEWYMEKIEIECSYIQIMSAYSIMRCDEAITALLSQDTPKAAFYFTLSLQANDCCWESKVFEMRENESSTIRSNLGRKAVLAKLAKDPKQLALREIKAHFKESIYPFDKRGYRAKFCKEMAAKYPIIENIKTIENLFDLLRSEQNTQ